MAFRLLRVNLPEHKPLTLEPGRIDANLKNVGRHDSTALGRARLDAIQDPEAVIFEVCFVELTFSDCPEYHFIRTCATFDTED